MKKTLRIGTRASRLALAQSSDVKRRLEKRFPSVRFKLVKIRTLGDEFQSVELFKKTNIGVFTKALERKLISGEIDLAVHSLKDLPTELAPSLALAAVPRRLDPRDVLVTKNRLGLSELAPGARVGTGSPRRRRQIARLRPDIRTVEIRGNLDTRVRRVLTNDLDAIIVARAGLLRLKKYLKYARVIPSKQVLPAVGQAALALQTRKNDFESFRLARALNHHESEKKVLAERRFLALLEGGCRVPIGVMSEIKRGRLHMTAAVFSTTDNGFAEASATGSAARPSNVAEKLARTLLKKGAARFLKEVGRSPR